MWVLINPPLSVIPWQRIASYPTPSYDDDDDGGGGQYYPDPTDRTTTKSAIHGPSRDEERDTPPPIPHATTRVLFRAAHSPGASTPTDGSISSRMPKNSSGWNSVGVCHGSSGSTEELNDDGDSGNQEEPPISDITFSFG